ncbi:hypothetical protein AB835_03880 [Candidatus Endobugula sertula]|uniref:eCIS core domain-containing protein n=1 Tax=Candidatus Endobugula sertula TaxID=62101 RepID=A0A1D2QS77_9GAMM|nr:hypothetical protein AB835_03880 [Candidatus Endobugula sertula]
MYDYAHPKYLKRSRCKNKQLRKEHQGKVIQRKSAPTSVRAAIGDNFNTDMQTHTGAYITGLPDTVKTPMEQFADGIDLSDVKVHRNSAKPDSIGALAYTQGTNIHLGPGQERHLPHEAWHVVQQKQGRVRPTAKIQGGLTINNDIGLEREADAMNDEFRKIREAPYYTRHTHRIVGGANGTHRGMIPRMAELIPSSVSQCIQAKYKNSNGKTVGGGNEAYNYDDDVNEIIRYLQSEKGMQQVSDNLQHTIKQKLISLATAENVVHPWPNVKAAVATMLEQKESDAKNQNQEETRATARSAKKSGALLDLSKQDRLMFNKTDKKLIDEYQKERKEIVDQIIEDPESALWGVAKYYGWKGIGKIKVESGNLGANATTVNDVIAFDKNRFSRILKTYEPERKHSGGVHIIRILGHEYVHVQQVANNKYTEEKDAPRHTYLME